MTQTKPPNTLDIDGTTVTYQYSPDVDALIIRLRPPGGATRDEPVPGQPHLALRHDAATGEVMAIRVTSVQQFILERLMQDVVRLLMGASTSPSAAAVEPVRAAPTASSPASTPAPETHSARSSQAQTPQSAPRATDETDATDAGDEESSDAAGAAADAPDAPHKRRRRRRKKSRGDPEAQSEIDEPQTDHVQFAEERDRPQADHVHYAIEPDQPQADRIDSPAEDIPEANEASRPAVDFDQPWTDYVYEPSTDAHADIDASRPAVEDDHPTVEDLPMPLEGEGAESDDVLLLVDNFHPEIEAAHAPAEDVSSAIDDLPQQVEEVLQAIEASHPPVDEAPARPDEIVARSDEFDAGSDWWTDINNRAVETDPSAAATQTDAPDTSPPDSYAQAHDAHAGSRDAHAEAPDSDIQASDSHTQASDSQTQAPDSPTRTPDSRTSAAHEFDASAPDVTVPPGFAALELHPAVEQRIARLGFEEPTAIQRRAIPIVLSGRDLVGLAQTGTGKTLAFLAPSIDRLLSAPLHGHRPRLLVLTPTRELTLQVSEVAEALTSGTGLRTCTVYGGAHMERQTQELKKGVDVIVATPGRLQDHLKRKNVKLDDVAIFVLDEADRMLDMGFVDDIRDIARHMPRDRQTLLFGATMPPEIQKLSADFQRSPEVMEVARQLPPDTIEQVLFPLGRHLKEPLLVHLLRTNPQMTGVVAFTETKVAADVLARQLREAGIAVAVMHGDRVQRDREAALEALREGTVRVLVATNVAARGLDVEGISHVINFDVPQSVDEYVHRIGRTARAGAEGKAFTFVTLGDEGMIDRIEDALERKLERRIEPGFDYDVTVPSWAGPSPEDLLAAMHRTKTAADFSRAVRLKR